VRTLETRYAFDFSCEQCDASKSLAPNRNQTACLKCDRSDPNMLPITAAGECVCKEGYRAVEIDKLGYRFKDVDPNQFLIKCEKCPANQY